MIFDHKSKVLRRGQDYLVKLPQSDQVELVVPASMVGFIHAQLPPGNHKKVLDALPFLVESQLISAPEETHAVLVQQTKTDKNVLVAVIDKSWVQNVLAGLARADIFPIRMFPETILPKLPNQGWALVNRGHQSFVRTGVNEGFALEVDQESETPPLLIAMALQQRSDANIKNINLFGEVPIHLDAWVRELGLDINVIRSKEWVIRQNEAGINLLQGEFQPSGGVSRTLAPFKPIAIGLFCLLVMQCGLSIIDYGIKARENRRLDKALVAQFKSTFPEAKTIVDAPLQMQRKLDDLKHGAFQVSSNDYIALLSTVTTSIGGLSINQIKTMDYKNGALVLSLNISDLKQAEAMTLRLKDAGLYANIEQTQQSSQDFNIKLLVSAAAL